MCDILIFIERNGVKKNMNQSGKISENMARKACRKDYSVLLSGLRGTC